jgi:hypothetical protein
MAFVFKPSYLGGWDQEDHSSRVTRQKVCETPFQPTKDGYMVRVCNPNPKGLRQKDCKFLTNLCYIVTPCVKKRKKIFLRGNVLHI